MRGVRLERNVVVEIVGRCLLRAAALRSAARSTAAAGTRSGSRTRTRAEFDVAAPARAAEQLHPIGDDLRRVLFDAFLVRVLARLQPALDVDRTALLKVLARDLR